MDDRRSTWEISGTSPRPDSKWAQNWTMFVVARNITRAIQLAVESKPEGSIVYNAHHRGRLDLVEDTNG